MTGWSEASIRMNKIQRWWCGWWMGDLWEARGSWSTVEYGNVCWAACKTTAIKSAQYNVLPVFIHITRFYARLSTFLLVSSERHQIVFHFAQQITFMHSSTSHFSIIKLPSFIGTAAGSDPHYTWFFDSTHLSLLRTVTFAEVCFVLDTDELLIV